MRFMMMIKSCRGEEAGPFNPELMAAIEKGSIELAEKGILLQTGGLYPISKGVRVTVNNQKVLVTDGPFAETREVVGGFAIMELSSKEQAVELGRSFMQLHADILGPSYQGELEIRELMDFEDQSARHEARS